MNTSSTLPAWIKIYVIISAILILLLSAHSVSQLTKKEWTAERINIVDPEGNPRMVISNSERQDPGTIGGMTFERERPASIIFFNEIGDENGGLVYQGDSTEAGMVISYDQFADDQIMQLQYLEEVQSNERKYGLQLWQFPKQFTFKERMNRYEALDTLSDQSAVNRELAQMEADSILSRDRLFLGRNWNDEAGLFIHDRDGKLRMKVFVDSQDQPRIEFYAPDGTLQRRL